MTKIDPFDYFKLHLASIEKPARYLGGEAGCTIKKDSAYKIALCFPDLYEIGMSNNAMRILYSRLNNLDDIACERVFAVAPDFEDLLQKTNTTLYSLESGLALYDFDILAFSIGYELAATNVLSVLQSGKIELEKDKRLNTAPIIIAGGPALTNPIPYSTIFDAVWIGEAEDSFFDLIIRAKELKINGYTRKDILNIFLEEKAIWVPGKKAFRHIYNGFSDSLPLSGFPVPSVKPVQNHGVVEIMRGCPNSCRFCHATYNYRPRRLRSFQAIISEVEKRIEEGYKEISLSSLSSGDYPGISGLINILKDKWSNKGISFQLPSLKVESFPLDTLEALASGIRKSGLTFAIETALDVWQFAINKKVSIDKVVSILKEAQIKGYRLAKFYFMIGLPLPSKHPDANKNDAFEEEDAIIDLVKKIMSLVPGMKLNITLACFVPKPHTPFQWHEQLSSNRALKGIYHIKDSFKKNKSIKISYHNPELSWLEGLIARGDERVGEVIIQAFKNGARFDAWDDKFNKEAWDKAIAQSNIDTSFYFSEKISGTEFFWKDIKMLVSEKYLYNEYQKSRQAILTDSCSEHCDYPCGACNDENKIIDNLASTTIKNEFSLPAGIKNIQITEKIKNNTRLIFKFNKERSISLYAHHDIISLLSTAMDRAVLPLAYSEGYNPMPRIEISEPIALGIESYDEYCSVLLTENLSNSLNSIMYKLNKFIHKDLVISEAIHFVVEKGQKFYSLSNSHWGSHFVIDFSSSTLNPEVLLNYFNLLVLSNEVSLQGSCAKIIDYRKLFLTLRFTGKKLLGLQSIFLSAYGMTFREASCHIVREKQLAFYNNSIIDYIDLYKSVYRQLEYWHN